MHFAFTADQQAINEAARQMLLGSCQPADIRRLVEAQEALDANRWKTVIEMGLLATLAPEDRGGLGLGLADFVAIAEAAGYVALPEPLVDQAGLVVPLLAAIEGQDDLLDAVTVGDIVALGLPESPLVPDADRACALLLCHGDELHLVKPSAISFTRRESFDPCRRLFAIEWTPTSSTAVGPVPADLIDRARVLAAAQMVGIAQRAIDMAVAYAKDRQQFGKPIGAYQAVKHLAANAQVRVEFARPVVEAAAAELPLGSLAARARAAHAFVAAAEAVDLATRNAVQIHGAMGMTWEADLHFWVKRGLALQRSCGGTAAATATVIGRMTARPTGPECTFAAELADHA